MKSIFPKIIIFMVAAGALFFVARYLIGLKAIPSLSEYIANNPLNDSSQTSATSSAPSKISIIAPAGTIEAVVVTAEADLEKGLGGQADMKRDQGMLFVFPTADIYTFWMKDMLFSIDIVWISPDLTISGITENISPQTYPATFVSPGPVLYVLELNAGAAKEFGLVAGEKIM